MRHLGLEEGAAVPMKQVAGVWLPEHERHLVPFLEDQSGWVEGVGTYQLHKLQRALVFSPRTGLALDVGGHVGLWSMRLARAFDKVVAFEPAPAHRACFERNLAAELAAGGVELRPYALGSYDGTVGLDGTPGSSGDTTVNEKGANVPLRRFDDIDPGRRVDFVKLDCEGYELFALQGMQAMLERDRPCVIVEQKPGKAQQFGLGERDAVAFLEGLGATLRDEISGDFILSW